MVVLEHCASIILRHLRAHTQPRQDEAFCRAPEEDVLLVLDCGAFTAEAAYPELSFHRPPRLHRVWMFAGHELSEGPPPISCQEEVGRHFQELTQGRPLVMGHVYSSYSDGKY